MNDFDYDIVQKKRLVASARKQKCGSKSKKYSLPSDNLTAAQLKAKNGPVSTCNLNRPMSWEAFKALSNDLQQEYIKRLHSRFSVGLNTISMDLFKLSNAGLRQYLKAAGNSVSVVGKRLSGTEREVWERWLSSEPAEEVVPEEDIVPVECEEVEEEAPVADFGMTSMVVEWCGEFEPCAFMAQLAKLTIPGGRVKIRLEVEQA